MASSQVPISRIYAFDFETTGMTNIDRDGRVRVWLWSLVSLETRQAWYGTDIDGFVRKLKEVKAKMCFAHNLRFDGSFLLWWALKHGIPTEQIIDGTSKAWYQFRMLGVEFRDSLKKFPMTLQSLAYALGIPGKTEKPDFTRYIPAGYQPTWNEIRYCIQDSQIVAEAISQEYYAGRMRLTASSEAYQSLRATIPKFDRKFPDLGMEEDTFIRDAYAGGICFLKDELAGEDLEEVYVLDINSSYPSQMAGVTGQRMPVGHGWLDEPRRDQVYFIRFTSEFSLKKDHIPSLLSTRNLRYAVRSDNFIRESDGPTTLTMTSVDFEVFQEQYDVDYVIDAEFMSYESEVGTCAEFINRENEGKMKAAKQSYDRQKHKLNMNMSYGSFGINPNAWKVTPTLQDNIIAYDVTEEIRRARFCPYAAFVTSYGRAQLVRAFQKNFKYAFYTDTDSIHSLKPLKGLTIHNKDLGAWKPECWDGDGCRKEYEYYPYGRYLRPKAYCHADDDHTIFQRTLPDGRLDIEIKCAGIPDDAKRTLTWDNFRIGHSVEGKLQQSLTVGGACMTPTLYTI